MIHIIEVVSLFQIFDEESFIEEHSESQEQLFDVDVISLFDFVDCFILPECGQKLGHKLPKIKAILIA